MSEIEQKVPLELRDISREPRVKPKDALRKVTHTIALVPAGYVNSLWFEVRDYLGPAVARSKGRWNMESLHAAILNEQQHLWLAFDQDNKIEGVGTTELVDYPCKRMLAIQFLGAGFGTWWSGSIAGQVIIIAMALRQRQEVVSGNGWSRMVTPAPSPYLKRG